MRREGLFTICTVAVYTVNEAFCCGASSFGQVLNRWEKKIFKYNKENIQQ